MKVKNCPFVDRSDKVWNRNSRLGSPVRNFLKRLAVARPTGQVLRWVNKDLITVLCYHGLTSDLSSQGLRNYDGKRISVDMFERQVRYMSRNSTVYALEEISECLSRGTPCSPHAVVITFDDGYKSTYDLAFPILKRYGLTATFFVTTGFIGSDDLLWVDQLEIALEQTRVQNIAIESNKVLPLTTLSDRLFALKQAKDYLKHMRESKKQRMIKEILKQLGFRRLSVHDSHYDYQSMSWENISEMSSSGMSIGSHSHTHAILTRCNEVELNDEITRSKNMIQDRIQRECTLFCYPNGQKDNFDNYTSEKLRQADYKCGVLLFGGYNTIETDPFQVMRFAVGTGNTLQDLKYLLTGCQGGILCGRQARYRKSPFSQ